MHEITRVSLVETVSLTERVDVGLILIAGMSDRPLAVDQEVEAFVNRRYGVGKWRWVRRHNYNEKGEFFCYGIPYVLADDGRCLSMDYGYFDLAQRPSFPEESAILNGLFLDHLAVEICQKYNSVSLTSPDGLEARISTWPVIDPFEGWTDAQVNELEGDSPLFLEYWTHYKCVERIQYELADWNPLFVHTLVDLALTAGYNRKTHGLRVMAWIVDQLARFIDNQIGKEHEASI